MALNMKLYTALNKLAKWRTVLASWQLGTRPDDDAECKAVKDHREATIMLRAEVTALVGVLIKKGIITGKEFEAELELEAGNLDRDYERLFPGFRTDLSGVIMDVEKATKTMKGWRP